MNWLEFYKERYYKEVERKNVLNDKFNVFLTIITISGGGYLFVLDRLFRLLEQDNYKISIATFLIIIMSIIIAILYTKIFKYMYSIYYENEYEYLNTSKVIEEKRGEIKKYYDKHYDKYFKIIGGKEKEELIEEDMEQDLKEKFISAYDHNRERNDSRIKENVRLNKIILLTALLIILTYIIILIIPDNESLNIKNKTQIQEETDMNDKIIPKERRETNDRNIRKRTR